MNYDEKSLQMWAANVVNSPYWESVKKKAQDNYIDKLIEAAERGDVRSVQMYTFLIGAVDHVSQTIKALSIDTQKVRTFFESVIEDV